jgi:ABC-2 type transport system ATP-binding protein
MIGYLPESAPSYRNMTVGEFLNFIGEIRGFTEQEKGERLENVVDLTSLDQVLHQTIDTLSKGYKQRVGFAQALIHDPPVLILDEPTDGLDPNQKFEVRKLIRQMAKEKAIILSTHILDEMEAVCDRTIIINQGQLVADGTPATLLKKSSTYNMVIITFAKKPKNEVLKYFTALETVGKVVRQESMSKARQYSIAVYPKKRKSIIQEIHQVIVEQNITVLEIREEKGKMEEVFRNLTIGEGNR